MVSKAGKLLLKNTIQSLEHQNKVKEEKEMWNKWRNEKNERVGRDCGKRKERDLDHISDRSDSIEDKHKSMAKRHKSNDRKPDNYWLKKLMAEEEKLSDQRWTHNGFKELYSRELDLNSENSSSDSEQQIKKKSKKKKKKHKKHHKKHKTKSKRKK